MAGEKRGATEEEDVFLSGEKSLEILWKIHYNPACGHEVVNLQIGNHFACKSWFSFADGAEFPSFLAAERTFEKLNRKW